MRGLLSLAAGDTVSVWIYAGLEAPYKLSRDSDFTCVQLDTAAAFAASLAVGHQHVEGYAVGVGAAADDVVLGWEDLDAWNVSHTEWGLRVTETEWDGWEQLTGWETAGIEGRGALFEHGGPGGHSRHDVMEVNLTDGRFTVPESGLYLTYAQIRLDGAVGGPFELLIGPDNDTQLWNSTPFINVSVDGAWEPQQAEVMDPVTGAVQMLWNTSAYTSTRPLGTGLRAVKHDGVLSATVGLCGVLRLEEGQTLSVWVHAPPNSSYAVSTQSGWGAALIASSGFGADLSLLADDGSWYSESAEVLESGWNEVGGWATAGVPHAFKYFSGPWFDMASGRYTAARLGLYLLSAQLSVIGAAADEYGFAIKLAFDGNLELPAALSAADSHPSPNFATLAVAGVTEMEAQEGVSLWVRADGEYTLSPATHFSVVDLHAVTNASVSPSPIAFAVAYDGLAQRWSELSGWVMAETNPLGSILFANNDEFDPASGRFTARGGVYFASAQVHLLGADHGAFRAAVRINAEHSYDGLRAGALQTDPQHHPLGAAGLLKLDQYDFISVWVYADTDDSFAVAADSRFSCMLVQKTETAKSFSARLHSPVHTDAGWMEIDNWFPASPPRRFTGGAADRFYYGNMAADVDLAWTLGDYPDAGGRYTADRAGVVLAAATLRLHGADAGVFRLVVGLNGQTNDGLRGVHSGPAGEFMQLRLSGAIRLVPGDYVSVWVHADEDQSYTVKADSSFSCALMETAAAFGAKLTTVQDVDPLDWVEVIGWETGGSAGRGGLFALGGGFEVATGRYTAEVAGLYIAAANIEVVTVGGGEGSASAAIALNSVLAVGREARALQSAAFVQEGGIAVTLLASLAIGDYLSVWVRGIQHTEEAPLLGRPQQQVSAGSGFSVVLASTETLGPSLTNLQFYGYAGPAITVQHFGSVVVRSEEGDVELDSVSNMEIDVKIGRERSCPHPNPDSEPFGLNWG